jgi:hypothetical protein
MRSFAVDLHGENFVMEIEEDVQRVEFEVTRYVEGESEEDAELAAVELVRERLAPSIRNIDGDPPIVYVNDVRELPEGLPDKPQPGFLFIHP